MAGLNIIQGAMGAGKTYYGVYKILERSNDKEFLKRVKESGKPALCITNIKGINVDGFPPYEIINLYSVLDRFNQMMPEDERIEGVDYEAELKQTCLDDMSLGVKVLRHSVFKKVSNNFSHIFVVIDEAHLFYPSDYYQRLKVLKYEQYDKDDMIQFITMCRHINVDVMLLTQTTDIIWRKLIGMADDVLRGFPPSKRVPRSFQYRDRLGLVKVVLKRKEIFNLYKSSDVEESRQGMPMIYKVLVGLVICIFSMLFLTFFNTKKMVNPEYAKKGGSKVDNKSSLGSFSNKDAIKMVPGEIIRHGVPRVVSKLTRAKEYNSEFNPDFDDFVKPPVSKAGVIGNEKLLVQYMGNMVPIQFVPDDILKIRIVDGEEVIWMREPFIGKEEESEKEEDDNDDRFGNDRNSGSGYGTVFSDKNGNEIELEESIN